MAKLWMRTALFNLFLVACIGTLLRLAFVVEISWLKFMNWLHGHSHVAMLGWVYLALFTLLIHKFLDPQQQQRKVYRRLFWLTQASVVGMLVAFPIQGYGPVSIAFSTLHVLLSYIFAGSFFRDLNRQANPVFSTRMVKTALVFLLISTLGLWVLAPVLAVEGKQSQYYYMAVQFFLHFQFNGWFIFAVLGLFFKALEKKGIGIPENMTKPFYWLLVISCFLTYALAVAWANPEQIVFWTNSLGVVLQLAALVFFIILIKTQFKEIRPVFHNWSLHLLKIAFLCFIAKVIIQAAVVIPYIATVAYTIRNYVIGFLHLLLLGVVSVFILSYAIREDLLPRQSQLMKTGLTIFLAGFLLSETILFLQGTMFWGAMGFLPYYYEGLFGVTVLLPVGVGLLLIAAYRYKKS